MFSNLPKVNEFKQITLAHDVKNYVLVISEKGTSAMSHIFIEWHLSNKHAKKKFGNAR